MIQIGLALPLFMAGVAGAIWRHYRQRSNFVRNQGSPASIVDGKLEELPGKVGGKPAKSAVVFDDVDELQHYQKMSWYALAIAASGSWFYPPAVVASLPLLGYNSYHLYRVKLNSDPAEHKTPLSVFEIIGVFGTLVTGRALAASLIFLASFGGRNLLLQAGNIANNVGLSKSFNPNYARVWVLRDGAEVEASVNELVEDDVIILHQGDIVAVSGKVVRGNGVVRQFGLHKKVKLLPKQVGDKVHTFTQVESGNLYIQPRQ